MLFCTSLCLFSILLVSSLSHSVLFKISNRSLGIFQTALVKNKKMQENMHSNIMETSDKINNRTHHTRFFEKLYGNLEKSSDKSVENEVNKCSYAMSLEKEVVNRQEVLNSPSESSGSSSEIYQNDLGVSRCDLQKFHKNLHILVSFTHIEIQ